MPTNRSIVACLFLVLIASLAFATNGTRMNGFDAKTVGRGGTSIGFFDNGALLYTNPAGISFLEGSLLDGNFSLMVPGLNFTNSVNAAKGKTNYFPIANLSYVKKDESRLTWGAGVFTQGGMGADFMLNHNLFRDQGGNFVQQEYHSKLAVMQGGLSAAYALSPEFSIGASAHLVYSMLDFRMPYSLSPSVMKGVVNPQTGMTFGDMFAAPPQMGGFGYREVTAAAAMNDLTAFGFSGKVGVAWKANENATLGVSYTSSSPLTYKSGKANMDMTYQLNDAFGRAIQGVLQQNPGMTPQEARQAVMNMFGQLGIDMSRGVVADYDLETKLAFPQSIGLGGMVRISEGVRLGFDFEWINWENAFDKMTIVLKNGNNPNINRMLGNDGTMELVFPMNWKDAFCSRIGLEVDASDALTLRAGGAFGSNPVPDNTVFPVFPAIVENHATVGLSYKVSPVFAVNAAYEHAFNKAQKSLTPSLLASEYDGSTSELSENIFHLSFSWSMR